MTVPTGFRVVDYKTGRGAQGKDGQLAGGEALQLPLYLLAGASCSAAIRRRARLRTTTSPGAAG